MHEGGDPVALGFIGAVENAYRAIGAHPAAGSPRYARELGLPGLRSRRSKRYPYVVFHVERDEYMDIWRVLHGRRDIAEWLAEPRDD